MKRCLQLIFEYIVLAAIGGFSYYGLEVMRRGSSHASMIWLGAICFIILGLLSEVFSWDLGLIQQSLIGAIMITALEFVSGLILNVYLNLNVWDYSFYPYNIAGQVCLQYFLLWIPLSCVAIIVDDFLRYFLFKEEKPHYKLI